MRYLVDTSVLLRLLQRNDPNYSIIRQAVRTLLARGDELCCEPQNIVEFWNVSTRPASARGGFGLTIVETDRRVRLIERVFTILDETAAAYLKWLCCKKFSGHNRQSSTMLPHLNILGLKEIFATEPRRRPRGPSPPIPGCAATTKKYPGPGRSRRKDDDGPARAAARRRKGPWPAARTAGPPRSSRSRPRPSLPRG